MNRFKLSGRDIVFLLMGAIVLFMGRELIQPSQSLSELFVRPVCDANGDCVISIEYGESKFYLVLPGPETISHVPPFL